jgi:hypothetical protein
MTLRKCAGRSGSGHAPERGGWRARRHSGRAMSGPGGSSEGVAIVDPSMSREHRGSFEPAVSAEEIDDHLRRVPDRPAPRQPTARCTFRSLRSCQVVVKRLIAVRLREADPPPADTLGSLVLSCMADLEHTSDVATNDSRLRFSDAVQGSALTSSTVGLQRSL